MHTSKPINAKYDSIVSQTCLLEIFKNFRFKIYLSILQISRHKKRGFKKSGRFMWFSTHSSVTPSNIDEYMEAFVNHDLIKFLVVDIARKIKTLKSQWPGHGCR